MKHVVLISCMNETDDSIIYRTNVRSDVVVINQCDKDDIREYTFKSSDGDRHNAIFINTTERGLSRSRNMAIKYAPDDAICQICDDDEVLDDNASYKILQAYAKNSKASVITFYVKRIDKIYPNQSHKIGFKEILKTSSVQITFIKKHIVNKDIHFDTMLGSGTGNGSGEEIDFLLKCRKMKLKLYYVPEIIASLNSNSDSKWFSGYNDQYMRNFGWSRRRIFGSILGCFYIFYWLISHKNLYSKEISIVRAMIRNFDGYFDNR